MNCLSLQSSTKKIDVKRLLWFWILLRVTKEDGLSNHNTCLTWNINSGALRLVCRLSNDRKSVSLLDPQGNHRAHCNVRTKGMFCFATYSMDNADFLVSLKQIGLTTQSKLEGEWVCKQENSSYTTAVNRAKGIISSTSVYLNGKKHEHNGELWTNLTCGSCREPYANIAEFQIGGRTVAHLRYLSTTKTCVIRNETCNGTTCMCSQTGNEFFLRLKALNGSRYSCVMLFVDKETGVRFQQTSSLLFDGKAFKRSKTKTKRIKNATFSSFRSTTDLMSTRTNEEETSNIFVDFLGVWIACLVLTLLSILVWVITKIGFNKNRKDKMSEFSTNKSLEVKQSMLEQEKALKMDTEPVLELDDRLRSSSEVCKGCSMLRIRKKAVYMCFECRHYFCAKCLKTFHNLTKETVQHKTVDLNMVPAQFSVSIFNCSLPNHDNALLQYFCLKHKQPICKGCKSSNHKSCNTEVISDMSHVYVTDTMYNHQTQLQAIEGQLISFEHVLKCSFDSFKYKTLLIRQQIESSEKNIFQINEGNICTEHLTETQAKKKLDEIVNNSKNNEDQFNVRCKNLHSEIEEQNKLLEFVLKFGENHHALISATCFDGKEILLKLNEYKHEFSDLDITFDQEKSIIAVNTVSLTKLRSKTSSSSSDNSHNPGKTIMEDKISISSGTSIRPTAKVQPHIYVNVHNLQTKRKDSG